MELARISFGDWVIFYNTPHNLLMDIDVACWTDIEENLGPRAGGVYEVCVLYFRESRVPLSLVPFDFGCVGVLS